MPLRSKLLHEGAAAREYTMRFVRVPELTAESVRKRYEPLGNGVVRYRTSGYHDDITFDEDIHWREAARAARGTRRVRPSAPSRPSRS